MSWASVAVTGSQVGFDVYKAIKANQQEKQAAKEAANLRRPFYQIQPEYYENKNMAATMAGSGFTSAEKTAMNEEQERGLSSSLGALEESGAGPNDVSQLNRIFSDSLTNTAAEDARLHMEHIKFFTDTNKDLATQKTIQWGVNEKEPFETKLNELQQRRTAAQTNLNNAVEEGIGSLSAGATSLNSYFMNKPPMSAASQPDLAPYSRNFGLADTGGTGFSSPASQMGTMSTTAPSSALADNPELLSMALAL